MRPVTPLVVVVVFEDRVDPGLARAALRNRWSIVDGRNPGVVKQVMLAHAKAIVMQVPETDASVPVAVHTLSRLARHWVPMVLLAVASYGATRVEAAVRQAGCDVFLAAPASEQIDSTMEQLLPGSVGGMMDKPALDADEIDSAAPSAAGAFGRES